MLLLRMQHRFVNAFRLMFPNYWRALRLRRNRRRRSRRETQYIDLWRLLSFPHFYDCPRATYNGRQALSMSKNGVGKIEKQGQMRLLLSDKKALSSHPSLPISNTQYSVKLDLFDIFRIELAFNLYNSTPSTESFGVKQMCLTLSQKV